MLLVAGCSQDDKYREWSILEKTEKLWTRLAGQHVDTITKAGKVAREEIENFQDSFIVKRAKQKAVFQWDMVKGLRSLADTYSAAVPIDALEILDWVTGHARTSVQAWADDNIIQQSGHLRDNGP